jgi:sorbitol-specific phosphotransferase system component IIC
MAAPDAGDVVLGLGLEFVMLGIATGVASISDEVGGIMVVFMVGLLLLWLMYHVAITNAIPNLFKIAQGGK